jgi:N-acetylneuraminic acid mutarotase
MKNDILEKLDELEKKILELKGVVQSALDKQAEDEKFNNEMFVEDDDEKPLKEYDGPYDPSD